MKRFITLSSFIFVFLHGSAPAQTTVAVPDTGWHLWLDRKTAWEHDSLYLPADVNLSRLPTNPPTGGWKTLDDSAGIRVTLPSTVEEHFWGTQGFRRYRDEYFYEGDDSSVTNGNYRGVSWWWRSIDIPGSFKGKHVVLFIRGERLRAEVYCNSILVGYNIITETSFRCDITAAVRPGKRNVLAIRITNPGGRLDWLDTQLTTWGSQSFHKSHGFGGLDRGIEISAHDPVSVTDLWALNTPDVRTITAHAALSNNASTPADGEIRFEILDTGRTQRALGRVDMPISLGPGVDSTVTASLTVPSAHLWDVNTPVLYTLRALVTSHPRKPSKAARWRDRRDVKFGFRWFEADGIGTDALLRLNGRRIRLTSAISWGFWGFNGLWPTHALAEREVRAAKTLGMNCIQFHRNIGKAEVLDLQDSLGLLRYMEPGGGQTALGDSFSLYAPSPRGHIDDSGAKGQARSFAERYMEEKILRMVRDHRRHPSLLLYSIQNEIHPDLRNPRIFHLLRTIHAEDPSRIVVLKSGFPSGTPSVNQAWMQPYSPDVRYDTGDGVSGWWDDHTVGGPGVWRDEMYRGPEDFTHRSTNRKEIVMWGEMLGSAVPDNHAAMVRQILAAGGTSYDLKDHQEILSAYDRFLDRWGFRPAFPTADALFSSIGNKSYDFWGRVIETARLAEANDYFVMSGWESTAIENHSGLVDNLRDFKGDPSLIGSRLAPLRPVVKFRSLVAARGSSPIVDCYLLNETHAPHSDTLRLTMSGPSGASIQIGSYAVPPFQQDRFVYHVAAGIVLYPLMEEGEVTLRASIGPPQTATAEDRLIVVDTAGNGPLPRDVGIISATPSLFRPFEPLPGMRVRPYRRGDRVDLVIAAGKLIRPPQAQTEPDRKIRNTEDEPLYRSIDYGTPENFDYVFKDLPGNEATITFRFVEAFQNAPGVRVFDVAVNGVTMLKDFDVWTAAGGKDIAFDTVVQAPIVDGLVEITVPQVKSGSARFAAIKIEAGDSVVAINCGGTEYRDKKGLLWREYSPAITIDSTLLARVREGSSLLVLAEGETAVQQLGDQLGRAGAFRYLGHVGEARASWMGSWYFVRKNPLYDGLPVDCGMGSTYQIPVTNADAPLIDGDNVEVVAGYSRDHDRNIGAASFTASLGKGKIVFHSLPGMVTGLNGISDGINEVFLKRLLANSVRYLTKQ